MIASFKRKSFVLLFVSLVLIIILFIVDIVTYTIDIDYDASNHIIIDDTPSSKIISQPSIIVVASINGGTSTLNSILLSHFKHFFHGFHDLIDMHYWVQCSPNEYLRYIDSRKYQKDQNRSYLSIYDDILHNQHMQFFAWNASFNNLKYVGCMDKKNLNNYFCNRECTHSDYMEHIGYINNNQFRGFIFDSQKTHTHSNKLYPNETDSEIYYYWDRTSGYNSLPYLPLIFATNYPQSKLLYAIRDPIFQLYSRIRLFNENTFQLKTETERHNLTFEETHNRLNEILQFVETPFGQLLVSLLTFEQNETVSMLHNEDNIISWYIALWTKNRRGFRDHRWFDFCPYINVLLYVKSSERMNKLNGVFNFKLIQFELMVDNLLDMSIQLYCWIVFNEIENCSIEYMNNSYEKIDNILFNWAQLKGHGYNRLKKYNYMIRDTVLLDRLIAFEQICDQRLIKLIQQYPSIVLGGFDVRRWNKRRLKLRLQTMEN